MVLARKSFVGGLNYLGLRGVMNLKYSVPVVAQLGTPCG